MPTPGRNRMHSKQTLLIGDQNLYRHGMREKRAGVDSYLVLTGRGQCRRMEKMTSGVSHWESLPDIFHKDIYCKSRRGKSKSKQEKGNVGNH